MAVTGSSPTDGSTDPSTGPDAAVREPNDGFAKRAYFFAYRREIVGEPERHY
jgi:hypothetical protein